MNTRSITKDNVMQLIDNVVSVAGAGHKDPNAQSGSGCRYADIVNQRASCIVGRVLELSGLTFEEISALDSCGTFADVALSRIYTLIDREELVTEYIPDDILPFDFEIDLHSIAVLKAAQRDQDHGNDWGYASASARLVDKMLKHGGNPLAFLNMEELID